MKKVVFVLFFGFNMIYAQDTNKKSRVIEIIESFTIEDFKTPNSILFYSGGHWESEYYYKLLFKKLKKHSKKTNTNLNFIYEQSGMKFQGIDSFNDINIDFINDDYDSICFIALGEVNMTKDRIINPTLFFNYELYLILVESKSNRVLLKRKFNISTINKYYFDNNRVAKHILKELNISQ